MADIYYHDILVALLKMVCDSKVCDPSLCTHFCVFLHRA